MLLTATWPSWKANYWVRYVKIFSEDGSKGEPAQFPFRFRNQVTCAGPGIGIGISIPIVMCAFGKSFP